MDLRVGELVEVRSLPEILATLDEAGRLDAMPFMPEMLKYVGKRFTVLRSAHKTCDTIDYQGARKLEGVVHLETRCNGEFHGGCQAGCLMFWKQEWLKRVERGTPPSPPPDPQKLVSRSGCTEAAIQAGTLAGKSGSAEPVYSCQATELNRASKLLPWWDLRQYVRDVRSGNISVLRIVKAFSFFVFSKLLKIGGYRALIWGYDRFQAVIGGIPYPFKTGKCETATPVEALNLQPGELVQIKSQEEILQTVNRKNRNRGLSFDEEMVGFCGGTYRVLRRVERIINEKTGTMMKFPNSCIVLGDVVCQSRYKNQRLFCPRSIYPYWREIWLRRVPPSAAAAPAPTECADAK